MSSFAPNPPPEAGPDPNEVAALYELDADDTFSQAQRLDLDSSLGVLVPAKAGAWGG
jgi:hypothetical protein